MIGDSIIRSEYGKNGTVVHHASSLTSTIQNETYFSRAVRCGLTWPALEKGVPGYFCIFGEQWVPEMAREDRRGTRGKLILLSEHEHGKYSLLDFCKKLGEETARLCCDHIYATGDDDFEEETLLFNKYCWDQHIKGRLEAAPYWKKPGLAIGLVHDWQTKGLLEIPENTVLYEQMKRLQTVDLVDLREKFFAASALCFVVGAFEVSQPYSMTGWTPKRR